MKSTIYFANIKTGYKICIIDKDGAAMGNAFIPYIALGVAIETFIEHINDENTEVKEVSEVKYDKLLEKGIAVAKNKEYVRVSAGNDPTNKVKN